MPLDVTASHSVEARTTATTATDTIRIGGLAFGFDDEWMAIGVSYGIKTIEFVPKEKELWVFSGDPLISLMGKAPVGTSKYAVLKDMMSDIVTRLQTTTGLKQQLISDGNLVIKQGAIESVLTSS